MLKTSVQQPAIAHATELVPQSEWVIEELHLARDGVYLRMLDGGLSRLKRLTRDGALTEIPLPFDGSLSAMNTSVTRDGALFSLTGWLTPADIWSVDAAGQVAATGLTPKPSIDVSPYETQRRSPPRAMARARPTILYRPGPKPDGQSQPSSPPTAPRQRRHASFAGRAFALMDFGCIVATPTRGGEYGRLAQGQQLVNKQHLARSHRRVPP